MAFPAKARNREEVLAYENEKLRYPLIFYILRRKEIHGLQHVLEDLSRKSKKAASNRLPLEQLSFLQEQSILNTSKRQQKKPPSSPMAARSRGVSPTRE